MEPCRFELAVLSEFAALSNEDRRATFVFRVDPPEVSDVRTPARIVLALDVSGSMRGYKLGSAVASAKAVVQALGPEDTFACVLFSIRAAVLVPPTPATAAGKQAAIAALGGVRARSRTNLGQAITRSVELASGTIPGRVLLLTDGCPTEGVTEPNQLVQLTRGVCGSAVVSCFGYGEDADPALLQQVSAVGRGTYHFVNSAEPPLAAIAGELGGALMTVGTNAVLSVAPAPGVTIERTHQVYSVVSCCKNVTCIDLPTLVAGEPAFVACDLRWTDEAAGADLALATLRLRRTSDGSEQVREARVAPRIECSRGALVPAAVRAVLLAQAATALYEANPISPRDAKGVAEELALTHGELIGRASLAGILDDPQVTAALEMLSVVRQCLLNGGRRDARRRMIAYSEAMYRRKATDLSEDGPRAYCSESQRRGMDVVARYFAGRIGSGKE